MTKRILVTGSHGYIGAVLVPKLLRLGHKVVGLDTDLYYDASLEELEQPAELLQIDLRDIQSEALQGIDTVVHLAALSNDPLGNFDASLTNAINYEATVRLARLCKQAGVQRFLFSSSCSSYGAAGDELLDETAALQPVTAYSESKVKAERDLAALADEHFCVVSLRNATAYGFSPRLRLDLVINDFVTAALLERRIFIMSDGTPWRPLVHVEDICSAFIALLDAPSSAISGHAFNIGDTRENYRVSELARIVADQVPDCKIEYAVDGGPDLRCYRVSCDRILEAVPTFRPAWNVQRGASDLLARLWKLGIGSADVKSRRFHRLAGLQRRIEDGSVDVTLRPTQQAGDRTRG